MWFYSPGGFLIGSGAVFNLGGLVLTAADPVTFVDASGNTDFINSNLGPDTFNVSGVAGSQSAITIQSGAQIHRNGITGHSTYMVAIAPQINNAGTINVAGSTAMVAAESALFQVDPSGLFTIAINAGSTVSNNTFVNTGSVGSTRFRGQWRGTGPARLYGRGAQEQRGYHGHNRQRRRWLCDRRRGGDGRQRSGVVGG